MHSEGRKYRFLDQARTGGYLGTRIPSLELMLRVFLGIMLCACLSAASLRGQAVWGTISGYVTDPSGSAIPGATVTATNKQTGTVETATTNTSGGYDLTHLAPATYDVSMEAKGFQRFTQQQVRLAVGATVRIDAKLELGTLTQQITVQARAAQLETEKTEVTRRFTTQEVSTLPILSRNVTQLYTMVPGVVRDTFQMGLGENPSGNNRVFVNGTWSGAQTYTLDGISDVAWGFSGLQIIVPLQDAVQEMSVTTANYDAEFGQTAGMVAQYVTKSGTNELHGSFFYYNRNKETFAADPITEKIPGTGPSGKGLGVAPFNFNQGGFSLGGPIKKHRVFLFGAAQFDRYRQGASVLTTVPNDAFRSGDFSALTATRPIYDPTTGNPDGTGRQQFSCNGVLNVICPDRIDPVATNLLALVPGPNVSQAAELNYAGSIKQVFNANQVDLRGDVNLTNKDKMFVRYTFFWSHLNNPGLFGVEAGGPAVGLSPEVADSTGRHGAVNWTHTFGSSLLVEARGGYSRQTIDALQLDYKLQTNDKVGIPNLNTGSDITGGLAGITIAGPVGGWFMGVPSGYGIPRFDRTTNIEGINNWTWMHNTHQLRFGAAVTRERFEILSSNSSTRGNFSFGQGLTSALGVGNSGLGMAAFLLGMPTYFDRAIYSMFPGERQTRLGLYVEDRWRLSPKLTLSLGLRYDYFTPVTPRKAGGIAVFDPNSGDLLLGGLGDVSRSADITTPKNHFTPRLGIAYRLTADTVMRAGFGRSYFGSGYDAVFIHLTKQYPIVAQQTIQQASTFQPIFPIADGPPAATPPAFPSSGHLPAPDGTRLMARPFDWETEQMDTWNFTIERQLASDTTLSVGYVGSKGTHLSWQYNMNAAPPGPGTLLSRRPFYVKYGLSQNIMMMCNCSDSNYHALQIQVKKSYSKNLNFTSNFVWSKMLSYGTQNPFNRELNYGPGANMQSAPERAVTFTLGHTFVLPYGTGQRFGANASGIKKAVLGGWQFSGVTVLESGLPLTPGASGTLLNSDIGQRADRVQGCDPYDVQGGQSRRLWYNPACFARPSALYTYGNAAVGTLRGPGLVNADFALWKGFDISTPLNREKTTIQLRMEGFNIFNHANLGTPAMTVDSPTAGRISSLLTGFPMRRFEFGIHMSW